jgi:ATP-dependent Lon protease
MTENATETKTENRILELPILPLHSLVIFPSGLSPLTVGRPLSLAAAEAALSAEEKLLGVLTQRSESESDPTPDLLYSVGTLVVINRMIRAPGSEEVLPVIVNGQERIRVLEFVQQKPYLKARIEVLPEPVRESTPEVEALRRNLADLVQRALNLLPNVPPEMRTVISSTTDSVRLAYFLGSVLALEVQQEQALLEADSESDLLRLTDAYFVSTTPCVSSRLIGR